ncbi:MAG: PilZ domain-containing protein [Vicinamibacteria bacterium]|nr:PilZ domain-containing protein [Vicinamibacteria bacterium]
MQKFTMPSRSGCSRRMPRLRTQLAGVLEGRMRHDVQALDLSMLGCLLRAPVQLDRGFILDLNLDIEGMPLVAKARVVDSCLDGESDRNHPCYLLGIEFLSLDPASTAQLRRFLEGQQRKRVAAS